MGKSLAVTFGLTSPHHGTVMALAMVCKNRDPLEHIQRYHGDGSMRATAIQAEFQNRGGRIEWINLGDDGKAAVAKFTHPIHQPSAIEIRYTIEDAAKQVGDKLTKPGSNWATNPGAMLRAALMRKAIKIIDPGIIGGFDTEFDEFADQQAAQSKPAKKSPAERRKELEAENAAATVTATDASPAEVVETHQEPVIDAVVELPETAPFPTEEDDSDQPATNELLQEIVAVGKKIPSQANPGSGMTVQEISNGITAACKVSKPQEATRGQIRKLIARFRAQLGEK